MTLDERQREMMARRARRYFRGDLAPEEAKVQKLHDDREAWRRRQAITYFMSSKLGIDPHTVDAGYDATLRTYFGKPLDDQKAYAITSFMAGADTKEGAAADAAESAAYGKKLGWFSKRWADMDEAFAAAIKLAKQPQVKRSVLLPDGTVAHPEFDTPDRSEFEKWQRRITGSTVSMIDQTGAGIASLLHMPKTARQYADRAQAVTEQYAPSKEDLEKLRDVSGSFKSLWSGVWWRENMGSQIPTTGMFVAGGWGLGAAASSLNLLKFGPKLAPWIYRGVMAVGMAGSEAVMNAGQAIQQAKEEGDARKALEKRLLSLSPEKLDAVYTPAYAESLRAYRETYARSMSPDIAAATARDVFRRTLVVNTLTDLVSLELAGSLMRRLRLDRFIRPSRRFAAGALANRGVDAYMQIKQELWQNRIQDDAMVRHLLQQSVSSGWLGPSVVMSFLGDDPQAFDTALTTLMLSGRSLLVGSLADVANARSIAETEGFIDSASRGVSELAKQPDAPKYLRDTAKDLANAKTYDDKLEALIRGQASEREELERAEAEKLDIALQVEAMHEDAINVLRQEMVADGIDPDSILSQAVAARESTSDGDEPPPPPDARVEPPKPEERGETPAVGEITARLPVLVRVEDLKLSPDVPNWKAGADPNSGVVSGQELLGKYYDFANPIVVWERSDGGMEIVTGRHRWDLAKRLNVEKIPAYVVREADGFTAEMARIVDVESNILDEKGSVLDYALYFRNNEYSEDKARDRGLLSRPKQRSGFFIGRFASPMLFDRFSTWAKTGKGRITERTAGVIAEVARGDEALEAAGIEMAGKMSIPALQHTLEYLKTQPRQEATPEQPDLFGFDASVMEQAQEAGRAADKVERRMREELGTLLQAIHRQHKLKLTPVQAERLGITDPKNIGQLERAADKLRLDLERMRNWAQHPELVQLVNEEMRNAAPSPTQQPQAQAPAEPAATTALAPKEPWQMTRGEYLSSEVSEEYSKEVAAEDHLNFVGSALLSGWDVPERVLADYPSLKRPQYTPWVPEGSGAVPTQTITDLAEFEQKLLGGKRPYEVTEAEFNAAIERYGKNPYGRWDANHEDFVEWAVEDGKPVPSRVLEEYRGDPWADAALKKIGETGGAQPAETASRADAENTKLPEYVVVPKSFEGSRVHSTVFHGSDNPDIEQFIADPTQAGGSTGARTARLGAFFSESPVIAAVAGLGWSDVGALGSKAPTLYVAALNLQKPLLLDMLTPESPEVGEIDAVLPGFADAVKKYETEDRFKLVQWLSRQRPKTEVPDFETLARERGLAADEIKREFKARSGPVYDEWVALRKNATHYMTPSVFAREALDRLGYDGIIVNTMFDSSDKLGVKRQYIASNPEAVRIVERLPMSSPRVEAYMDAGKADTPHTLPEGSPLIPSLAPPPAQPAETASRAAELLPGAVAALEKMDAVEPLGPVADGAAQTPTGTLEFDDDNGVVTRLEDSAGPGIEPGRVHDILRAVPDHLTADVAVIGSVEELTPQQLESLVRQLGQDKVGRLVAFYDRDHGTIVLVADKLANEAAVLRALVHENLHRGIREYALERFRQAVPRLKDVIGDAELRRVLGDQYADLSPEVRIEEYLANLAEAVVRGDTLTTRQRTVWQRILDWFRDLFGLSRPLSLEELAPSQDVAAFIRELLAYHPTETDLALPTPSRFMTKMEQRDAADFALTHYGKLHEAAEKSVAGILAGRMAKGIAVNKASAARLLRPFGLEGRALEVLETASRVHQVFEEEKGRARDDQLIVRQLTSNALNHYRMLVDMLEKMGRERGELSAKAKAVYDNELAATKEKALKARTGMTPEAVALITNEDPAKTLNGYVSQEDLTPERWQDIVKKVKKAVHQQMLNEGVYTERKVNYERNPLFRRELQLTLARLLTQARVEFTAGLARKELKADIREMKALVTSPAIERHAERIALKIQDSRVTDGKAELLAKVERLLGVKEIAGRLSTTKLLEKRGLPPDVIAQLKLVSEVFRVSGDRIDDSIAEVSNALNDGTLLDPERAKPFWRAMEARFTSLKLQNMRALPSQSRGKLLLSVLAEFGGLRDRFKTAEIANKLARLRGMVSSGKSAVAQAQAERDARLEPLKNLLLEAVNPAIGDPKSVGRLRGALNAFLAHNMDFHGLIRAWSAFASDSTLARLESEFLRPLRGRIAYAHMVRDTIVRNNTVELRAAVRDITGLDYRSYYRSINTPMKGTERWSTGKFKRRLTRGEVMQLVGSYMQEDFADREGAKHLPEMLEFLRPEDLKVIEYLQDWYAEFRTMLEEASVRSLGIRIPEKSGYLPAVVRLPKAGPERVHKTTGIVPPFLTERVIHGHELDDRANILDVWTDRVRRTGHFIGFAELAQDIVELFGQAELQDRITELMGPGFFKAWQGMYSDLVTGGFGGESDNLLETMRGVWTISRLTWNVGPGARQLSSLFTTAAEIGLKENLDAFKTADTPEGIERIRELRDSEYVRNRIWFGAGESMNRALRTAAASRIAGYAKLGMRFSQIPDLIPILAVAQHVYGNLTTLYLNQGMELTEAKRRAMAEAWDITTGLQQSRQTHMLSHAQRRWGTAGRWLASFQGTQRQKFSTEAAAWIQYIANPTQARRKKLLNIILLFHVVGPTLFQALNLMVRAMTGRYLGDDDKHNLGWAEVKEWLAFMVVGPLSGPIVLGRVIQGLVEGMFETSRYIERNIVPAAGGIEKTLLDVFELTKHLTLDFDLDGAIKDANDVAQDVVGGYGYPRRLVENLIRIEKENDK